MNRLYNSDNPEIKEKLTEYEYEEGYENDEFDHYASWPIYIFLSLLCVLIIGVIWVFRNI